MNINTIEFNVEKKVLSNGMTILVKPAHHIPRVEAQIWYNVGSKHENARERGMAHLIEHMLFKGTDKLSESDINMISHKLTGYTNAFTSQDCTCYVFRFPSNVWKHALSIFSDCMQNARFDEQMLNSEVKAVIEELRLYKDDYQTTLIQELMASIFPTHPYHYPIIGTKHDLAALVRDDLFAFYKKHYHPGNATLIVVGDVDPEEVFKTAEEEFGSIPAYDQKPLRDQHFEEDIIARTVTLYREIQSPWSTYFTLIPGLKDQKNYIFDVAALILAQGKSSRLHKRLVEDEELVSDVESFVLDFFEKGIFGIGCYPFKIKDLARIESIIQEELDKLATGPIEQWEFEAARKKVILDYASLLESCEKQATLIGNNFLATKDETSINNYLKNMAALTPEDVQAFFKEYFSLATTHKGYLCPLPEKDASKLVSIQQASDRLEQVILEKHVRTSPVEPGKAVEKIPYPEQISFSYPKPQEASLENGLDLVFHNNPETPYLIAILNFKANPLYDPSNLQGLFHFLLSIMTDRTKNKTCDQLNEELEREGIILRAGTEGIYIKCLTQDFEKALTILNEILNEPSFDTKTIERNRKQILSDIAEYWDNPSDFIDQIAKEYIYGDHPYSKNAYGTKSGIENITLKDLEASYQMHITPRETSLTVVGNLDGIDLPKLTEKTIGSWQGNEVPDICYPSIGSTKPQIITHPINRDQVVLSFVAPTISRTDDAYLSMVLLDIILTGGASSSMSSRLFQLREQSGLFYTIGGSLVSGARHEPGMMKIKTIVSTDKVEEAQNLILKTIGNLSEAGISEDEFILAKNILISSLTDAFETNGQTANTFSFLKKYDLSFNLFDKQLAALAIIKIRDVNDVAEKFCNPAMISTIRVGRFRE